MLSTNHIEKLDPAVTRPERINLEIPIGHVGRKGITKFINFRYPGHKYTVVSETQVQPSLISQAWRLNRSDIDNFVGYLNQKVGVEILAKRS